MVYQQQSVTEDEEAFITSDSSEPEASSAPLRWRVPALVAGGLAACAAVAYMAAPTSGPAAPRVSMPGMGIVGLNEEGEAEEHVPQAPAMKSFIKYSKPFHGGRDFGPSSSKNGRIKINEDGVMKTYYLPGSNTVDNDTTVKYEPPYRFYLMKEPTTDYSDASKFYKMLLIGKTFSVDMDFSRGGVSAASCGCNLNFYMVDMPVADAGKDGDHYCDGQCFPDLGCCAEWDMNEGNANVQQITNHACSGDYAGHADWKCHKWGSPESKTTAQNFGLGSDKTIDTKKKFTFEQEYRIVNERLVITTRIKQGSKQVSMKMGPSDQLDHMWKHGSLEKGMAFVTGYWSSPDMNWLDSDECGAGAEHCNNNPAYISNWKLTTNSDAPEPSPDPSPSGGHCGWHGKADSNSEMTGWCDKSEENCNKCEGGKWVQ